MEALVVVGLLQVAVELGEGEFVARFMSAVLLAVLLDCLVGQVYEAVHIAHRIFAAAGTRVALPVQPDAVIAVSCPHPNVELPFLIQQWFDVLLHYVGLALRKAHQ